MNADTGTPQARAMTSSRLGATRFTAIGQFWKGRTAGANSREDQSESILAEMIGTTRSRLSHFMNKFRKLGFIDYNGHLEVHNSLLGVLLADQPRTVSPPK